MNKRVLFLDNGVVNEWSPNLNNYNSAAKVFPFVAGQDYLYIGSKLPFNHLYFKLEELNVISSTMSVEYYSNGWNSVVELIDETNGFTESGFITFTPNRNSPWVMKPYSNEVSGLSSVIIYDEYWLRISFSNSLTSTTSIKWLGNILSDDYDLGAEFPDLIKSEVMYSYKSGKTNWQEQHIKAAEIIENDLINKGVIDGQESILHKEWYRTASVQKTAEIIFSAFGDDYIDQRAAAREEYKARLTKRLARVDKNQNGSEEVEESRNVSGFLSR